MLLRNQKTIKYHTKSQKKKEKRIPLLIRLLKIDHEREVKELKKEIQVLEEENENLSLKIMDLEDKNTELEDKLY